MIYCLASTALIRRAAQRALKAGSKGTPESPPSEPSALPATSPKVEIMLRSENQTRMPIPTPRGEVSTLVIDLLAGARTDTSVLAPLMTSAVAGAEVTTSDDLQLSLFLLYELHYRGLAGVPDEFEWDTGLLAGRAVLEGAFEAEVRQRAAGVDVPDAADLPATLFAMTAPAPTRGPSLSRYLATRASIDEFREFLTHRSVYHLKEADPHAWAIPRLGGRVKAALVEIEADEFGGGRAERMHATLFGNTMRALGLDARYGALVDQVPGVVLAGTNAMSMFGLHRRLVGAIVGHLAAFEMTSSMPNRLYGNGLRRLGFNQEATLFFDEHVEADAVHEQIAGRDLAGNLAKEQPELASDIVFGAAAALALDELAGDHLLQRWEAGQSSLRAA